MTTTQNEPTRPRQGGDRSFDRLLLLVGIVAVITAVLAAIAAIRGGGDEGGATAGGSTTPTVAAQTVAFTLSEFAIDGPSQIGVAPTTFDILNRGSADHNLVIEGGPRSSDLGSGATELLDVGTLAPGTYTIFCDIVGHREAGMETTLVVAEGATAAPGDHDHGAETDWSEHDMMMIESMLAFPAATEGIGNQLLEPTILPDGTKEYHLTVAVTPWLSTF